MRCRKSRLECMHDRRQPAPTARWEHVSLTIDDRRGADRLADVLAIDVPIWNAIVAHLRRALPNEGVGLLATDADADVRRATRFFPGTNIDASPTRFTMEPREVLETFD